VVREFVEGFPAWSGPERPREAVILTPMLRVLFTGENWYRSCARDCCYALPRIGLVLSPGEAAQFAGGIAHCRLNCPLCGGALAPFLCQIAVAEELQAPKGASCGLY
jgi:hypothetical protein